MSEVRITVLVENEATAELGAEHGWAALVEAGGKRGLFDTGESGLVVRNARALGVDLGSLDWIALSHGHYDHTGGLRAVLAQAGDVTVHAHPEALGEKLVRDLAGQWREAGMSVGRDEARFECSPEPVALAEGVTLTGEVPRVTDYETVPDRFVTERDGRRVHDEFPDDQALILATEGGLVVVLGCAHAGVVNTVLHAREITGEERVRGVLGGMHLVSAPPERIEKTIAAFREWEPELVGPAHCTGEEAVGAFRDAFGERCVACPGGTVLEF